MEDTQNGILIKYLDKFDFLFGTNLGDLVDSFNERNQMSKKDKKITKCGFLTPIRVIRFTMSPQQAMVLQYSTVQYNTIQNLLPQGNPI